MVKEVRRVRTALACWIFNTVMMLISKCCSYSWVSAHVIMFLICGMTVLMCGTWHIVSCFCQDEARVHKVTKRINTLEEVNINVKLLTEMLSHYNKESSPESDREIIKVCVTTLVHKHNSLYWLQSGVNKCGNISRKNQLQYNWVNQPLRCQQHQLPSQLHLNCTAPPLCFLSGTLRAVWQAEACCFQNGHWDWGQWHQLRFVTELWRFFFIWRKDSLYNL